MNIIRMTKVPGMGEVAIIAEKVSASFPEGNGPHCTIVVAHIPESHEPYVCWVHNTQDGGYYWGRYRKNLEEAMVVFNERD